MDSKSQYFELLGLGAHRSVLSIAPFLLGGYLILRLIREYVYRKSRGAATNSVVGNKQDGGDTEVERTPEFEECELIIKVKQESGHDRDPKSFSKHYHVEKWEDAKLSAPASAVRVVETMAANPKVPIRRRKVPQWNNSGPSPPQTPLSHGDRDRDRPQPTAPNPETPRTPRHSVRISSGTKTPSRVTVEIPPRTTPKPPYIPPPTDLDAPTFSPGDLVLRRRPSRFVHPGTADADEYDGPFILASTSNPAPVHLHHVRGAKLASWAKLELPPASSAERWTQESKLVHYTGALTVAELREATKERDGTFIMDKIRSERWVQARGGVLAREFRVSWLGYPCEDDTWELEGKVYNTDWHMIEEFEGRKA